MPRARQTAAALLNTARSDRNAPHPTFDRRRILGERARRISEGRRCRMTGGACCVFCQGLPLEAVISSGNVSRSANPILSSARFIRVGLPSPAGEKGAFEMLN